MFAMGSYGSLRRCGRCRQFKPVTEFGWHRKHLGQWDTYCRPCRSAYGRDHYLANRQRYVDQAQKRKEELGLKRTRFLLEYFRAHPCVDCGETDSVVLEFDHLREKTFNIGSDLSRRRWNSILAEMAKCEVVCANCHRRRTGRRRGSLRTRLTQG